MSVDDWAREQAEREARLYVPVAAPFVVAAVQDSLLRVFDALLSDEAVEAAEEEQYRHGRDLVFGGGCACGEPFPLTRQGIRLHDVHVVRAALQAAIDAVTKGARSD